MVLNLRGNNNWWVFAAVALGAFGFVSLHNSKEERKARPSYTAHPDKPSMGLMKPFVVTPGGETARIGDFKGTHLRWWVTGGNDTPVSYYQIGMDGEWIKGCKKGAWNYKFVLPPSAKGPVTIQVERRRGAGGTTTDTEQPSCNDQ